MFFKKPKDRSSILYDKMTSYCKRELRFFNKSSLEVVGLTRLKCKYWDYIYSGQFNIEYLEVVSHESDFEGIIVRRNEVLEDDLKIGIDLGTFYVIKNRRGDIRFVEIGIEDDPICTVAKRAKKNFLVMIVLPRIFLGIVFTYTALSIYFS